MILILIYVCQTKSLEWYWNAITRDRWNDTGMIYWNDSGMAEVAAMILEWYTSTKNNSNWLNWNYSMMWNDSDIPRILLEWLWQWYITISWLTNSDNFTITISKYHSASRKEFIPRPSLVFRVRPRKARAPRRGCVIGQNRMYRGPNL